MPNTPEMNELTRIVTAIRAQAAKVIGISDYAERASAPSIISIVFLMP